MSYATGGESKMRHFTQSDVRKAAVIFGTIQKAEKLGRGRNVLVPLYESRNKIAGQFHHQHSFAQEVNWYLASHPEIMREIKVPK